MSQVSELPDAKRPMAERRIVVLCDNESAHPACGCEWGLSLAIDLGGTDGLWLWDTGQTNLYLQKRRAARRRCGCGARPGFESRPL